MTKHIEQGYAHVMRGCATVYQQSTCKSSLLPWDSPYITSKEWWRQYTTGPYTKTYLETQLCILHFETVLLDVCHNNPVYPRMNVSRLPSDCFGSQTKFWHLYTFGKLFSDECLRPIPFITGRLLLSPFFSLYVFCQRFVWRSSVTGIKYVIRSPKQTVTLIMLYLQKQSIKKHHCQNSSIMVTSVVLNMSDSISLNS